MIPKDVAKSYDDIAERWTSDNFPLNNGIAQHERAIAFIKEKRAALDVGCGGSGRIFDLPLSHGFKVEGLDVSARMIALARQRHPSVVFHQADICDWELPQKYDLISAWDSIWHVPLSSQGAVLAKLMQGLTPGGVCIFTTGGLDAPSEKVDAAMGVQMYYGVLGIPRTLALIAEHGCVCRHLEYDQYPESHWYVIAQRT